MRKNLVLVKFGPNENACHLMEIPMTWMLGVGDTLLAVNPALKREQEVTVVCESFPVYEEKKFEEICMLHKTTPVMVKRALGYVTKETEYFGAEDWNEESAEEINEPLPDIDKIVDKLIEDDDNLIDEAKAKKQIDALVDDFVEVIGKTCSDLGIDYDFIRVVIGTDDEEDEDDG